MVVSGGRSFRKQSFDDHAGGLCHTKKTPALMYIAMTNLVSWKNVLID